MVLYLDALVRTLAKCQIDSLAGLLVLVEREYRREADELGWPSSAQEHLAGIHATLVGLARHHDLL